MTPISWGVDCGKPQGCRGCWSCQPSTGCMFSFFHCVSIFSNSAKKASKAVLEEACRTACCFSSPTRDRINWLLAFCCNTSLATLSTSSLVMKSGLACLSSTATLAMSTRNLFAKKPRTVKWHHELYFSHQLNAHKQFQNLLSWVIDGQYSFLLMQTQRTLWYQILIGSSLSTYQCRSGHVYFHNIVSLNCPEIQVLYKHYWGSKTSQVWRWSR